MPTLEENQQTWQTYEWPQAGDEWSWEWGSPDAQWFGTLLPRVYRWLPAAHALEIAPGFGRWTQFLKGSAQRLSAVDLSQRCVDACRERFSSDTNIEFHVNDGRTLSMIADRSVDFAFSFDSLVHVERDVLGSYIRELARVLTPDGAAFVHHSNLASYRRHVWLGRQVMRLPRGRMKVTNLLEPRGFTTRNLHWRAASVNAPLVVELARSAGLQCITQEIVSWGGPILNDCFSVLTPAGSRWAQDTQVLRNPGFMDEVHAIAARERLYHR